MSTGGALTAPGIALAGSVAAAMTKDCTICTITTPWYVLPETWEWVPDRSVYRVSLGLGEYSSGAHSIRCTASTTTDIYLATWPQQAAWGMLTDDYEPWTERWIDDEDPVVRAPQDRAKALFLASISDAQRAEYERDGQVTVHARSGRRYVVECRAGRHGNIVELARDGQHAARLCVAPQGNIPHFDALLGQIAMLQYDEPHIREKANFTALRPDYRRDGIAA